MKSRSWLAPAVISAALALTACETVPPGVERGPSGTVAYDVLVDATPPGAQVEANGKVMGNTPIHLKIFGDKDGTFHDFGSYYYTIRGLPLTTNQYVQTAIFRTGRWFTPEDVIPQRIYFDMNQKLTTPPAGPVYIMPGYPAPYYGPRAHFYFGPGPVYWHW